MTSLAHHRQAERLVIRLVQSGELAVDCIGRIWRMAARRGIKTGGSHLVPCEPRRAEHETGPEDYLHVRAVVDGERHHAMAHRLVWQYFHGDIPDGLTLNHINGCKQDNRPSNLELATPSEQALHAHAAGLAASQVGERNGNARFTDAEVAQALELRARGLTQREVAEIVGMSPQHVSRIERGLRRTAVAS